MGLRMKILVTGSEGYIGFVLVSALQQAGHDVVGLDACFFSNRKFILSPSEHKLIKADIRDVEVAQLEGFNAICHLAALANDPAGDLDPETTKDINYRGTVSLAKKAKQAGVERFIFSSSCSMFGTGDTSTRLTEDAEFKPVTAYGESKVLAERGVSKLAGDGFSPVFLRNATAYGVSPKLRLDLVVNNLVAWAFTTGKIAVISDGTPWRPLAHVKDICMAFKCSIEAPVSSIHNQSFNVGRTDANYQVKEIAEVINALMPEAVVTFGKKPGEDPDRRTYKVSFEKVLKHLPGFKPMFSVEDGIRELLRSYEEFGLQERHLSGDEFITTNRYKRLLADGLIGHDFRWTGDCAS